MRSKTYLDLYNANRRRFSDLQEERRLKNSLIDYLYTKKVSCYRIMRTHYSDLLKEDFEEIFDDAVLYVKKTYGAKKFNRSLLVDLLLKKIRHLIINLYNSKKVEREGRVDVQYPPKLITNFFEELAAGAGEKLTQINIKQLLLLTTDRRKEVLIEFYLRGGTHVSTARRLKVSEGTIKKLLSEGRNQIIKNLTGLKPFIQFVTKRA